MGVLVSNSYRMWAPRLVVVLVAVGGGVSSWALSGEDDLLEASGALQRACQQAKSLQDVDALMHWESTRDEKPDFIRILELQVSGDNTLVLWDERPGEAELYMAGTLYKRSAGGEWTKKGRTGAYEDFFTLPLNTKSLCPELANFTYAATTSWTTRTPRSSRPPPSPASPTAIRLRMKTYRRIGTGRYG